MATSSSTSTHSPKISMLKAKTGFIIPKNKLSSSLVPAYKGVKKADGSGVAQEESTKQMQRKTKWGPDFTQDATVRKGRALAYQTRVDQITQLLESGSLASRNEKSSPSDVNAAEHELLELEKQEAIGEILKINPTYKTPSDYKPLVREARVPLPMKEDVGYSFVNLVFGPSDTQKRVERESGAAIRVYGTKLDDGNKIQVEVSASDGNELLTSYKDLHVLVSADSYEKVDVAVALIEFIVSSVSGKPAAEAPFVQGDDTRTVSQNSATDPVTSVAVHNQGSDQSVKGSVTTPHGNVQPNTVPWPQMGSSPTPGFSYFPNSSASVVSNPVTGSSLPFYPSNMPTFSPMLGHASGFGSASHNSNHMPPRSQPPYQSFPNSLPPFEHPSGQYNTPSNSAGSPFSSHQLGSSGPSSISGFPAGHSPQGPLTPAGNSGWGGASQMAPPVSATAAPAPMVSGPPRPLQTQSSASMLVQHFGQVPTSPNNNSLGSPIPRPLPPAVRPSFTPVRSMRGPAPVAQQNNAGDFMYHHPPDRFPHPNSRPSISGMQLPPAPPSFRPAMQAPPLRPPMGNQMGHQLPPSHSMNHNQIPPSNMNAHMGPRNHNMFPPNAGPSFLPRHGNAAPFQQAPPFARPGNPFPQNQGFRNNLHMAPGRPNFGPSGGHQFYDPFSPTAVPTQPQHQGGSDESVCQQENDPEYEDLMASVGVK